MQSQRIGRLAAMVALSPANGGAHIADMQQSQAAMVSASARMQELLQRQRAVSQVREDLVGPVTEPRDRAAAVAVGRNATYVAQLSHELIRAHCAGHAGGVRSLDARSGRTPPKSCSGKPMLAVPLPVAFSRDSALFRLGLLCFLVLGVLEPLLSVRCDSSTTTSKRRPRRRATWRSQRNARGNGVLFTDVNHRIVWANEGFTRLTGYTLAEVSGKTPGSVLGSEHTSLQARDRLVQAIQRCEAAQVQLCNRAKDGREYWVDVDLQPLLDDQGGTHRVCRGHVRHHGTGSARPVPGQAGQHHAGGHAGSRRARARAGQAVQRGGRVGSSGWKLNRRAGC